MASYKMSTKHAQHTLHKRAQHAADDDDDKIA
jgi:hypothetical protein